MTVLSKLLILFKLVLFSLAALSSVSLAAESGHMTVEQHYDRVQTELVELRQKISLQDRQRMKRISWKKRLQLPPRLRGPYETWYGLIQDQKLWQAAIDLKQRLLALQSPDLRAKSAVQAEADQLSQSIMGVFREKSEEWNMLSSALMNNMLINMKIRENGFCWHWVEAFMEVLYPLALKFYDLYWGVAYLGTVRENNSLVITAVGQAFADGLMIDAWRTSGRPFWRQTNEDRFPWVERTDIRVTYCDGEVCTVATDEWVDPET